MPTLRDVVTADELAQPARASRRPEGDGADPAFIQYTSGSTGQPKGVLLTHANLLANIRAIASGLELQPTDVGVSWLPLYHDMGLIGSWLMCLHNGVPLTLLPPTAFLARPERWLWAIHERRATLSVAPNFAYELMRPSHPGRGARRPRPLVVARRSQRRRAGEPGDARALRAPLRAARGFSPRAMTPVYGLAECSVALAFPPIGRGPRVDRVGRQAFERDGRAEPAAAGDAGALEFVSAGRALPEHEIRIVDDEGHDVAERVVGRLVFRGPSMTSGYYRQPEATAAITLPGGWLDSGDLAYLAEGEIYICGRRKDLIIKGGRNLVPQEIEEAGGRGRRACGAAAWRPSGCRARRTAPRRWWSWPRRASRTPAERERLAGAVIEAIAAAVEACRRTRSCWWRPARCPRPRAARSGARRPGSCTCAGNSAAPPGTTLCRDACGCCCGAVASWLRPLVRRRGPRRSTRVWLALGPAARCCAGFWAARACSCRAARFAAPARSRARAALRLLGCTLEALGLERLPARGPFVLACQPRLLRRRRRAARAAADRLRCSWPSARCAR